MTSCTPLTEHAGQLTLQIGLGLGRWDLRYHSWQRSWWDLDSIRSILVKLRNGEAEWGESGFGIEKNEAWILLYFLVAPRPLKQVTKSVWASVLSALKWESNTCFIGNQIHACGGFLAIFGVSWLVDLCLRVRMAFSLCSCLSLFKISPFFKDSSHNGFRSHPTSVWPHLSKSHLQQSHSQIRAHSEVPGFRTPTCGFWENII